MSDKPYAKLCSIDRQIRRAFPTGMEEGTKITIKFITGFELFNTRPYHNYETWSDGWQIEGKDVTLRAEDLDDAVNLYIDLCTKLKDGYVFEDNCHNPKAIPTHYSTVLRDKRNENKQ